MGNDEISTGYQVALELDLNEFNSNLVNTTTSWNQYSDEYIESMQKSIDSTPTYYGVLEFKNLHEQTKNRCIIQVGDYSPVLSCSFFFLSFRMFLKSFKLK